MNVEDVPGWVEVDCREADRVRGSQHVTVSHRLTDPNGEHGAPVLFTEWRNDEGQPILLDYLWHPNTDYGSCNHCVPQDAG